MIQSFATKEMSNFKYIREQIVNEKGKIRSGMFVIVVEDYKLGLQDKITTTWLSQSLSQLTEDEERILTAVTLNSFFF